MIRPFRLKRTIGETYNMNLEDALNTKHALAQLGHLEPPEAGLDEFPDRPMIEAVKSFQRDQGLAEDGIMKPDGPTLERLNESLTQAQPSASRRQTSSLPIEPSNPLDRHLTSLPARPGAAPQNPIKKEDLPEGTQVAVAHAIPFLLGLAGRSIVGQAARGAAGAAAAGAAGVLMNKAIQEPARDTSKARMDIAPPMPPQPGYEPPDMPLPDRTESPHEPVELPDLSGPIPETTKPTIFILPAPDEGLQKFGTILEDRRGNFETKAEIERIQSWIEKHHADWVHKGGGVDRSKGNLKKEFWIPSVAKVFKGDGRKGGTFVDLSFETPSGKQIHIQTVDIDPKTGKVAQKELDAADRIRRSGKNIDVILIPKGSQMDKFFNRFNRK